jgi:transketolase
MPHTELKNVSEESNFAFDAKDIEYLENQARLIRRTIVGMLWLAGPERKGHPGGALSAVEIITALYFKVMKIDPAKPMMPERDRFILSKGHACPVLYSALALKGYFDKSHLEHFRNVGGMLQGHPCMKRVPGVDMTSGSLGHGLSAGIGMALGGRIDGLDYKVFVLLGDGECQEGLVWEAAMSAPRYKLDNLIAIVDINKWQSCDTVENILPMEPFADKWKSFGWNTIEIDGHDLRQVLTALHLASAHKGTPTVILAHTVKGKGVSFMENDNSWHQRDITKEQYDIAMADLGGNRE